MKSRLNRRKSSLIVRAILCLAIVSFLPLMGMAQVPPGGQDPVVDDDWKAEVIDSILLAIDSNYVFPDVAKEMNKYIRKQQKAKAYKDITDAREFTGKLTEDLQEISKDRHLHADFAPGITEADFMPDSLIPDDVRKDMRERRLRNMRFSNFGFNKLERLEGNVGYLDLRGFNPAEFAGATAVAAMNYLSNSEAIIIDLRNNGGGSPSMIQLISSYFFEEPTHLNNFYYRPADSIQQFWTQAHVQGPRMVNMPLYILTSSYTFSAAEEFTYNMKNLERATIIGETTGGGAHPVGGFGFPNLKVSVSVPIGRAVNPITGTNWEGTGIPPHIEVPREQALDKAHLEALKAIRDGVDDEQVKGRYQWVIETMTAMANPATVSPDLMNKYAGIYGPRTITLEDGHLYYQREGRSKYKMIPMTEDTFIFDEVRYFRLRFVTDESGKIAAVEGLYDNGHTDLSPRNP